MAIDKDTFKKVMGSWPAGVTVVTSAVGEERLGLTASAFCSVSLEPPLVLVCVKKGNPAGDLIKRAEAFAVSVLTTDQVFWGERFAGFHKDVEDRFEGLEYITKGTGCPILPDARAFADCKVFAVYDGGDHDIIVGEVLEGGADGTSPVLYYDRAWRGVGEPVGS